MPTSAAKGQRNYNAYMVIFIAMVIFFIIIYYVDISYSHGDNGAVIPAPRTMDLIHHKASSALINDKPIGNQMVKKTFCGENEQARTLPNMTVINLMDTDTLYLTFNRYVATTQIECCKKSIVGPANTFGKNICLDNFKKGTDECLVYSFGSQFHFEFEKAAIKSHSCEVHTFDPSLSTKGVKIPEGVYFHLTGLSDEDTVVDVPDGFEAPKGMTRETRWEMKSLSSIRTSLHHTQRVIDILKIDIEGWEWKAMPDIMQSGLLKYVRQLCLEVHFGYSLQILWNGSRISGYTFSNSTWAGVSIQNQLLVLKELYEHGFRIFKSDPIRRWGTYKTKTPKKQVNTLVELSLVNIYID